MKSNYSDIKEFHVKFGMEFPEQLVTLPLDVIEFRSCFMVEELTEYANACVKRDLENTVDSLIDLSYVILGTAFMHGENWDENHTEVQYGKPNVDMALQNPQFLSKSATYDSVRRITALIELYTKSAIESLNGDPIPLQAAMISLHCANTITMSLSALHGFTWQEHWDEVHKCNMAKERSSGSDDTRSKRKHSLDVVKPIGWVGPNHYPILVAKNTRILEKMEKPKDVNNH